MSVTHADFTIERRYPYTPRQTFSAFAEPELRRQWFANPGGWDDAEWDLDFRVGGSERNAGGGRGVPQPLPRHRRRRADRLRLRPVARRAADLGLADDGRVPGRGRRDAPALHRAGRLLRRRDRRRPARARDGQAARRARPLPGRGAGPMTLTLHEHPFAAYCWKALIAFYELDVPFERVFVGGAEDRARLAELWPVGSIPVLVDGGRRPGRVERDRRVRGARARHRARRPALGPRDRRPGHDADAEDRRRQPAARGRPRPVRRRRRRATTLDRAYALLDDALDGRVARRASAFSLADCAAAPALFYAFVVHRWDGASPAR